MSLNEESSIGSSTRNVEPMEVDEQMSCQQTDKLVESNERQESQFESYCASKSASEKVTVAVTAPVSHVPNSRLRLNTPCSNTAWPKVAVTRPAAVRRQNPRSLVNTVRPPTSTVLASGLPSPSTSIRPIVADFVVGDASFQTCISAPVLKTVVGQKVDVQSPIVLPADGSCVVFQIANPGAKSAISTGTTNCSAQNLSNSGSKAITSSNKTSRTPSIISRSRSVKKPQSSNSVHVVPVAGNAVTPFAASQLVRSSLLATSSNVVILNSPIAVTPSASVMVPALSSVGVDVGNSGRIIRLAGHQNFALSPLGTSGSKTPAGTLRFPAPLSSPNATPAHRFILTKTVGANSASPQTALGSGHSMSPLTSFRMQHVKNRPQSPAAAPREFVDVRPAAKEPEKLAVKRTASLSVGSSSEEGQERPCKRRKFIPGKAYRITFPDGQKRFAGFWENSMIRNFSGPLSDGGQMKKAVGQNATVPNDSVVSSKVGIDASQLNNSKVLTDETANLSKDQFFYCAKCQTLTSSNVPCAVCHELPQPCSVMSQHSLITTIPESPKKSLTVDQSLPGTVSLVTSAIPSPAPSMTMSSHPLVSKAGHLKPLQKIIVMQSGVAATKQIQITRKTPDQIASSSSLRLKVPIRIQEATGTSVANTTVSSANVQPIRKKVLPALKRTEPDIVQILSSDDEDNQATHSDSQPVVPSSAPVLSSSSSSCATHLTTTESQERQEKPSDAMMTDASSALQPQPVASPNCQLSIKIRIVRFGTLQRTSAVQCVLLTGGIKIVFNDDEYLGCCSLLIPAVDLKVIRVHYGPCGPVLFIQTAVGVATQLREHLPFQGHCFDPDHKDDACRYITIIPDRNQVTDEKIVSAMFEKMQTNCPASQRFVVQTIGGDVASQLLKAKPSSLSLGPPGNTITQTVMYMTASGQIIQRQMMPGELAAKPTEGDEEEEMADRSRSPPPPHPTFIGPIIKLFTYPPPPATGGITVANEDFFCLKDGEFLNDVIIDFYLKYLQREVLSKKDRDRTHVFSSFFYRRLVQKQANELKDSTMTLQQLRHCRVKKWTKHVDLFSKDFIVVPINESAHWYLAIICFPGLVGISSVEQENSSSSADVNEDGKNTVTEPEVQSEKQNTAQNDGDLGSSFIKKPCVLIFDSLAMPTRYGVVRTLREYLQCEWDVKKKAKEGCRTYSKETMQGACPRCPRQTNFSDCGIYVLQYVESFFNDPIVNFTLPISALANWFSEEVIVSKRESLRQLVLRLQKGLNPKLDFDPRQNSVDILTSGAAMQALGTASSGTAVESTDRVNSEGGTSTTGSVDSTEECQLAVPDGAQGDGNVAERVESTADSSSEIEGNNTQADGACRNGLSTLTGSSDGLDSISDAQSVATTQYPDSTSNCEAKGETAIYDPSGTAVADCPESDMSCISNQFEATTMKDDENVPTTLQLPVLSDDVVHQTTATHGRSFSETLVKDANDALSEKSGDLDNLDLQGIQSQLRHGYDGKDETEKTASKYNGQPAPDTKSPTNRLLFSFEQNSMEEFCEKAEAIALDSSKLCCRDDAGNIFGCEEGLDSNNPTNEMSITVDNQPS